MKYNFERENIIIDYYRKNINNNTPIDLTVIRVKKL